MKMKQNNNINSFIKWAGGKKQLIPQIEEHLPNLNNISTYVEPFVGGGALLFHLLNKYPHLHAVINDLNYKLINCYEVIKNDVDELIKELENIEKIYNEHYTNLEDRKRYFLYIRKLFNGRSRLNFKFAAHFIFLNKTCFNGLYRENKNGDFNSPFGKKEKIKLFDSKHLKLLSQMLQRVEILSGDYRETEKYISKDSFFYFDPPYRPLTKTSSFNSYLKDNFNNEKQIELKEFCNKIQDKGGKFLLSNSDPTQIEPNDLFFDNLYKDYNIFRIDAKRNINSKGDKRGKIKELLISNY